VLDFRDKKVVGVFIAFFVRRFTVLVLVICDVCRE
jgi:hypothetical protein